MPVDTEQMPQISLSDTINEWRVKYNSLVTAFNNLPSAAVDAVTRLGGTIDGDNSGTSVVEAQLGTLMIRTNTRPAAGIGIGKFLGASEPTVPGAQLHVRTGSNSAVWLETDTADKYAALVLNNSSTLSVTEITQNSISVSNATALFADDTGIYHSGEIVANTLGVWANGATGFKIIAAGGGASHDLANSQGTFSPSTKGFILHNAKFVANQSHLVTEGKSVFSRTAGLYWDNDTKIATAADGILAPSAPGFNLLNANTVANSTGTYAPRYGGFHSQPTETVDGAATALFVANTKGVIAGGEIGFSLANKTFVANNLGIYGTFRGTVATTQADFEATNFFKITGDSFIANTTSVYANSIYIGTDTKEYIAADVTGVNAPIFINRFVKHTGTSSNPIPPAGVNRISLLGRALAPGGTPIFANSHGIGISWNTGGGGKVAIDHYTSGEHRFLVNQDGTATSGAEIFDAADIRFRANIAGVFANSVYGYALDDASFVANNMGIHLSSRLLANSTSGTYAFVNPGFRLTTGTRVANSTGTYVDTSVVGAGFKLLSSDALVHDVANTTGTYADGGTGKDGFALISGTPGNVFRANNKMVLSPRMTIDVHLAGSAVTSGNNAPLRIIDGAGGPTDTLEPFGTNKISFGGTVYSNTIGIGTSYQPGVISFDSYTYDTFRWFAKPGLETFATLDNAMLFANTLHGFVANSSNGFSIGNAAAPGLDAEGGRVFVANTSMVYAPMHISSTGGYGFTTQANRPGNQGFFTANTARFGARNDPNGPYPAAGGIDGRTGKYAPIYIPTLSAVTGSLSNPGGVNKISLLQHYDSGTTTQYQNTIGFGVTSSSTSASGRHILDVYGSSSGMRVLSSTNGVNTDEAKQDAFGWNAVNETVFVANNAGLFTGKHIQSTNTALFGSNGSNWLGTTVKTPADWFGPKAPIRVGNHTPVYGGNDKYPSGVNKISLWRSDNDSSDEGTNKSFSNSLGFGSVGAVGSHHTLDAYSITDFRVFSGAPGGGAGMGAWTLSDNQFTVNTSGTFAKPTWGGTSTVLPIVANSAISNSTISETDGANYGNANGSGTLLGNIKMWFDTRNIAGGGVSIDLSSEFSKIWTVQTTQANPSGDSRPPRARVQPDERSIAFQHGGGSPGPVYSILVIGESV